MKFLNKMMAQFVQSGTLNIIGADGNRHTHGDGGEPIATVRITDKSLYRKLFLNPELHTGEAYMAGTLLIEDGGLRDLLKIFAFNRTVLRSLPLQKALKTWLKRFKKWHQRNAASASRKNVQHHYDGAVSLMRTSLQHPISCPWFRQREVHAIREERRVGDL